MTSLPRSARVALWVNAWSAGLASPDDVIDAFGADVHHVFLNDEGEQRELLDALGLLRRRATPVTVALPLPGHPLGLAGPPVFNADALEVGEVVLLPGWGRGVIPFRIGGAVSWRCTPANAAQPIDPREARAELTRVLREVTEDLVRTEIASWNTEIPDLLMNPVDLPPLPASMSTQHEDALRTAARCLAIVAAASDVQPGSINAREHLVFETGIRALEVAARRAVAAICSLDPRVR